MKKVRLIRHGQSAANAGEPTKDHASLPLPRKAWNRRKWSLGRLRMLPGLIVASPFLRAEATALATTTLYPAAAFVTWPIHEFTYLAPARCVDTTLAQRRGWVEAYWQRSDPAFSDGDGAESFLDLVARAMHFLDRLAEHRRMTSLRSRTASSSTQWHSLSSACLRKSTVAPCEAGVNMRSPTTSKTATGFPSPGTRADG
jgi:broad specificity phosphatase PhoE